MYVGDELELTGVSGKTYTFKIYPKSAQHPETGGIFIVSYMHPRGHLAGFTFLFILEWQTTLKQ